MRGEEDVICLQQVYNYMVATQLTASRYITTMLTLPHFCPEYLSLDPDHRESLRIYSPPSLLPLLELRLEAWRANSAISDVYRTSSRLLLKAGLINIVWCIT